MKRFLGLMALVLSIGGNAIAAPGDTTWVGANNTNLDWYGNYDSLVTFPASGKSYRNVYMGFTLGNHTCPSGSTWCGDWDYTVQNYLITPGGETFEIGRLITPYANAGAPRTPFTWTQRYIYDVTDYANLLHDAAKIRIAYSGYSGGFTANIRFAFVEGAPDREVLAVRRIWGGSYGYGDTSRGGANNINVHFPNKTEVAPDGTQNAELKVTVTGHGNDNTGFSEFCSKYYYVYLNNNVIDSYRIWRDDCGNNQLYPQSGTWLYNRGNWCPGAVVHDAHHALPGVVSGSSSLLGFRFENYAGNGGGSYTTEGTLFYYGGMKKTLDAAISDIVAPTNNENYFRENPIGGAPTLRIKNRGVAAIDSITFRYGLDGTWNQTYTWVGKLKTFEEKDINLGIIPGFNPLAGDTGLHSFAAKIVSVNGMRDADTTNNVMHSQFRSAPLWPSTFRVLFRSNNEPIATGSSISETSWIIYDMNDNIVKRRSGATINTLYTDTIDLNTGFYKFVIYDSSCDGLQWWVFARNPDIGINSGYITVRKLTGANIPMKGYPYTGTYNNDFGCGTQQYFYVVNPVGLKTITTGDMGIEASPNPAQGIVNVDINGLQLVSGTIQLYDMLGRVVLEKQTNTAHQQINVADLTNGMYTLIYTDADAQKLSTRLLIAK
jgi:hypothetical protein